MIRVLVNHSSQAKPVMKSPQRRHIVLQLVGAACAVVSLDALAQTPAKVTESDPTAVALGYKEDTTKVDQAKYPKHTSEQHCGSCMLYQGAAGSTSGPCPLFAGRLVAAPGWCSAWVKKAG